MRIKKCVTVWDHWNYNTIKGYKYKYLHSSKNVYISKFKAALKRIYEELNKTWSEWWESGEQK